MAAQSKSARWVLWLVVIAVLALGFGSRIAEVAANGLASVSVQPDYQQVLVGLGGFVDVTIESVSDLYAVQLSMSYDPSVIRIRDADPVAAGVQIGAGDIFDGLSWHVEQNEVDSVAGTIAYVFTLDNPSAGDVTGSGTLAHITFATLQPGSSPVAFEELVLANSTGTSISHQLPGEDALVRVVYIAATATWTPSASEPSPTPTNLPCEDPSPTPTCSSPCDPEPSPEPSPVDPPRPEVYFDPGYQWFRPSHEGWVDIRISNVSDLYAAWVKLSYDGEVLEILDSDSGQPGVQIEHGDIFAGKAWYPVANEVNSGAGIITYGAKLSFTEQASTGGGSLARIHFYTLKPGVSPFEFIEVILADQNGVSMTTINLNGVVEVSLLEPVRTPTATPTPRYSPTPPCGGATPTPTPMVTRVPEPGPLLYVYPDGRSMVVGEEATFEIRVRDVAGLWGAEFHLTFDPSLITIQDEDTTKAGTQIDYGGFITPDSVAQNGVDTVAGRVDFAISQAPPSAPSNGDGIIARMRIVAQAEGATPLGLVGTVLADMSNKSIPHGTAGGFVAIHSRTVVGFVRAQGRVDHQGVQIVRVDDTLSPMELLATTGVDGFFVFASPVDAGEKLDFMAMMSGYLPRLAQITVPTDPVVDVGTVILLGGDAVGPQLTADRGVGCPGEPTVQIPGEPDWLVSILDLTFVGSYFGGSSSDADWSPTVDGCHPEWLEYRADLNQDLSVNIFDLVQVGNNFGESGPVLW